MDSNRPQATALMKLKGWRERSINDVARIVGGGTPSTKVKIFWNGGIPWITPKDLSEQKDKYIERGNRNISNDGMNNSNAKIIPSDSVILSTRAPIGYIAISKRNLTTNQGCHSLVPFGDVSTECNRSVKCAH